MFLITVCIPIKRQRLSISISAISALASYDVTINSPSRGKWIICPLPGVTSSPTSGSRSGRMMSEGATELPSVSCDAERGSRLPLRAGSKLPRLAALLPRRGLGRGLPRGLCSTLAPRVSGGRRGLASRTPPRRPPPPMNPPPLPGLRSCPPPSSRGWWRDRRLAAREAAGLGRSSSSRGRRRGDMGCELG